MVSTMPQDGPAPGKGTAQTVGAAQGAGAAQSAGAAQAIGALQPMGAAPSAASAASGMATPGPTDAAGAQVGPPAPQGATSTDRRGQHVPSTRAELHAGCRRSGYDGHRREQRRWHRWRRRGRGRPNWPGPYSSRAPERRERRGRRPSRSWHHEPRGCWKHGNGPTTRCASPVGRCGQRVRNRSCTGHGRRQPAAHPSQQPLADRLAARHHSLLATSPGARLASGAPNHAGPGPSRRRYGYWRPGARHACRCDDLDRGQRSFSNRLAGRTIGSGDGAGHDRPRAGGHHLGARDKPRHRDYLTEPGDGYGAGGEHPTSRRRHEPGHERLERGVQPRSRYPRTNREPSHDVSPGRARGHPASRPWPGPGHERPN